MAWFIKIKCGQNSSRRMNNIQDVSTIVIDQDWTFRARCVWDNWNSQDTRSALIHQ